MPRESRAGTATSGRCSRRTSAASATAALRRGAPALAAAAAALCGAVALAAAWPSPVAAVESTAGSPAADAPPAAARRPYVPRPPQPPADGRTDLTLDDGIPEHAGADAIYPEFSRAYRSLDPRLVARVYAEDAVYVTPDGVVKRGRDQIQADFARFFDQTGRRDERMEIRFRVLVRRISGDVVTDVGLFTLDRFRRDEQLARDVGKFVTTSSPGPDGKWRFDLDSYSMVNQGDPN